MRAISICRYVLAPLLVLNAAAAQELENITVLPFDGWTGNVTAAREYQNALTDKIATKIIQSHRFNVIDRVHLDKVLAEQDLHLTGLIDESTVVQMGKVLGVHKLIVGRFTRNSTEHHAAEYYEGKKISDAYYSAMVQTTIKLLDVESGRYLEAAEAEGTGRGSDRRNALLNALDEVADAIMDRFEKYFAIQAYVTAVDKAMVTIDRGSIVGVQKGMDFLVFHVPGVGGWIPPESSTSDQSIGVIRIVSVESQTSRGRIMVGFDKIKPRHLVRESKEEITTTAMVLDMTGSQVIINAGIDLGIKSGMTFDVVKGGREIQDPVTGEVIRTSPITVGVIYITESDTRSARGKIIKGRKAVDAGMWILERQSATVIIEANLSLGLLSTAIQPNPATGTFTVENSYTGSHEITIDYSDYEEIAGGMALQVSGEYRDLVNSYSIGFGFGWFLFSSDLSAWAIDARVRYNLELLPEKLLLSPGISIGYGQVSQKLPGTIVSQISDDQSSSLTSIGIPIMPQIGLQVKLGQFTLTGDVAYRLWNATEWTYEVKTGKKTESGTDETKNIDFDSDLVPYPEVSVGGLYFMVGLSIEDLLSKISGIL